MSRFSNLFQQTPAAPEPVVEAVVETAPAPEQKVVENVTVRQVKTSWK